jgi:hypothetical protein
LARRRHSLLGGDIGHLGCLPRLRLGPPAAAATWCFAGRYVRTLFFSLFPFVKKVEKEKKEKKREKEYILSSQ